MSPPDGIKPELTRVTAEHDDKPTVLSVIRGLQSGTASPNNISISDRRACVEHLGAEGYSLVEIAEILKVAERTVARDRRAIHEANAIQRDPRLVEQIVGRLAREADLTISRLRRLAREKTTPASAKVDAEHRCYQVFSDLVQSLQRLGYLPTAAHEIRADLTHHLDDPPEFEHMLAEVTRLELLIDNNGGGDDQMRHQLSELKTALTQYSASDQIAHIKESLHGENHNDLEDA